MTRTPPPWASRRPGWPCARSGDEGRLAPQALWFSTTDPAYVDKTNATVVHAALRLDHEVAALDLNGSVRSAVGCAGSPPCAGAIRSWWCRPTPAPGLPTSTDEREGGDAAAAVLVGRATTPGPLLAEVIGQASVTEEFLDRWRTPGDRRSKQWEERFGELHYVALGTEAFKLALGQAGLDADDVAQVIVAGTHARAVRQVAGKVGAGTGGVADDLTSAIGNPGAAQPGLLLAKALEQAEPGQVLALVVLADGADVVLLRATDALAVVDPVADGRRPGGRRTHG